MTSYKDAGYLPEALLNGIALLGWNPPHREDPTVLAESTGVFLKHEVLKMEDMISQFNIDKISKSGAKFDIEKLQFFNSMHIRSRYQYSEGNIEEMKHAVDSWRAMLIDLMPSPLHKPINQMTDRLMLKVMDMMKVRLRYLHDIKNHTYLFAEADYETDLG